MIEQKYEFFIDTLKNPGIFEKRTMAKNINPVYLPEDRKTGNVERLMDCIQEYKINSHNSFFVELCKEYGIKEDLITKIFREISDLTISTWQLVDIDDLPEDTILFPQNKRLAFEYYQEIKNKPHIIRVLDVDYYMCGPIGKSINYGKNIVLSKDILSYTTAKEEDKINGLKYRIYVDDRLLIERFFPSDLPLNFVLAEECYLSLDNTHKISLVTDHNLIFTKIVSPNKTFYPNSKEFILEP